MSMDGEGECGTMKVEGKIRVKPVTRSGSSLFNRVISHLFNNGLEKE